jgi:hypothetical protein
MQNQHARPSQTGFTMGAMRLKVAIDGQVVEAGRVVNLPKEQQKCIEANRVPWPGLVSFWIHLSNCHTEIYKLVRIVPNDLAAVDCEALRQLDVAETQQD